MERREKRRRRIPQLNNRGSALILAMTILSFIAILGLLSMGTALLNVQTRGLSRQSEKNFYLLEVALDEIYAHVGQMSGEILKEQYADVVSRLYQENYATNEEANIKLKEGFMRELAGEKAFGISLSPHPAAYAAGDDCEKLAEKLKSYTPTFSGGSVRAGSGDPSGSSEPAKAAGAGEPDGADLAELARDEELSVTVGGIEFLEYIRDDGADLTAEGLLSVAGADPIYSGILIRDLCLTTVNRETQIESSLTVDMKIAAPSVRFINEGGDLPDYVMAANGARKPDNTLTGIEVVSETSSEGIWNGKVYGASVELSRSQHVTAKTGLLTAAGDLMIQNRSRLDLSPGGDPEVPGRVWANNIILDRASALTADNMRLYVQDDMTLRGNQNTATLQGDYYGYGNEGTVKLPGKPGPANSSAIVLNDKSSRLDLSGLNSLILAGRVYLNFGGGMDSYPLGESLAVRPTQAIYLIPVKVSDGGSFRDAMTLGFDDGNAAAAGVEAGVHSAGSNPVVLPKKEAGQYSFTLAIDVPGEETGTGVREKKGSYTVTVTVESDSSAPDGTGKKIAEVVADPADDATRSSLPATFIFLNDKLYVYYNLQAYTEEPPGGGTVLHDERSLFFEHYLDTKADTFESLLEKGDLTAGSIRISGGAGGSEGTDRIVTSGSLYEVPENRNGGTAPESLFALLDTRRGEGISSSMSWVKLAELFSQQFENIQKCLSENAGASGGSKNQASGKGGILPVGNFVNLQKIQKDSDTPGEGWSGGAFFVQDESKNCAVYLSGKDVTVELNGGSGSFKVHTAEGGSVSDKSMNGGLIVSTGNVTVTGNGRFNGLILAGGKISIKSEAYTLTADPDTYEPLLSEPSVSEYFYGYGDAASTVLNDYEDFVLLENWRRGSYSSGGGE